MNGPPNYVELIDEVIEGFMELVCNVMDFHLDYFPFNIDHSGEKHRERFHQDIEDIVRRHQGRRGQNMMADFFMLQRKVTKETKRSKFV